MEEEYACIHTICNIGPAESFRQLSNQQFSFNVETYFFESSENRTLHADNPLSWIGASRPLGFDEPSVVKLVIILMTHIRSETMISRVSIIRKRATYSWNNISWDKYMINNKYETILYKYYYPLNTGKRGMFPNHVVLSNIECFY